VISPHTSDCLGGTYGHAAQAPGHCCHFLLYL